MLAAALGTALALVAAAAGIGWWVTRRHAAREADGLIMDIDDHPDDWLDVL